MLLEYHAVVNSWSNARQTPLHVLATRETSHKDDGSDIAKLLLEQGANVNDRDKNGDTPLHLASHNHRLKIVRVLLDYGANADSKNDLGKTPLQLALWGECHESQEDGVDVALLLLEHNVQVYARSKYNMSTSDLARCIWKEKIWQTLVGSGGRIKPEDKLDQSSFRLWIEGEYCTLRK